ncbi:hypothetical protein [Deinococcus soli (ex Cha et al. 2016)]|uniref:hypothetical protein n=1 Tax=Deinococcus soli (ex Cha et al. 2016) TaxID=1309411 RepID=UPI00166CCCF5|nr:hypothetical protein [Deinococcus soli (ex Cha et al. 2016)]GGB72919.1 hypothetical protein GCM10008019_31380 [Deinococcus soli (ex Cha et al. 2016)]
MSSLDSLRAELDRVFVAVSQDAVRSVKSQSYFIEIQPTLTASELAEVVDHSGLDLPQDYVDFLLRIGNGMRFTGGSMLSLAESIKCSGPFLDGTFEKEEEWNPDLDMLSMGDSAESIGEREYNRRLSNAEYYFGDSHMGGSLIVEDMGCGYDRHLIVKSPAQRGLLWENLRAAGCGIVPTKLHGRTLSFSEYYEWCIRSTLKGLERELN